MLQNRVVWAICGVLLLNISDWRAFVMARRVFLKMITDLSQEVGFLVRRPTIINNNNWPRSQQ